MLFTPLTVHALPSRRRGAHQSLKKKGETCERRLSRLHDVDAYRKSSKSACYHWGPRHQLGPSLILPHPNRRACNIPALTNIPNSTNQLTWSPHKSVSAWTTEGRTNACNEKMEVNDGGYDDRKCVPGFSVTSLSLLCAISGFSFALDGVGGLALFVNSVGAFVRQWDAHDRVVSGHEKSSRSSPC